MESNELVGRRRTIKVVLATASLVLIISMGGQFLLPILLPGHLWAARRAGSVGRILWSLPAGVAGATFAWFIAYTLAGEARPAIWLAPLLVAIAATFVMWRAAQ